MASTFSLLHNFELEKDGKLICSGKQGEAAETSSTPLELSLAGAPFSNSPAIAGSAHGGPVTTWII